MGEQCKRPRNGRPGSSAEQGERGPASVEERERCQEQGHTRTHRGQARPPACKMLSWQRAENLGSSVVPRVREVAVKEQPEWGKDSYRPGVTYRLKTLASPSSVRVYLQRIVSAFLSPVPLFQYSLILVL